MSDINTHESLSANEIKKHLSIKTLDFAGEIIIFDLIDSTNNYAKIYAEKSSYSNAVILSEEQTNGKGRLGREFFSPKNTGIYMSILQMQKFLPEESMLLTAAAAVSVVDSIKKLTGIQTDIKWVNDIYYKNKKICGILTEGSINPQTGALNYYIIGIGINISTQLFPKNIMDIATSLDVLNLSRNRLIGEILNNISHYCENLKKREFMPKYKECSFVIGKKVKLINGSKEETVEVIDINNDAQLVVLKENGEKSVVFSGEISLRLI